LNSGSFHDEWHVFALEWEAGTLRWYVDDVLFHTVHRESEPHVEDWPFDEGRGFFLVLNLAVGGWFDAPHAPPEQFTPQRLEVDYVRVYRTIASGPDPVAD
jgi:beta-glucanase (GH16 family)